MTELHSIKQNSYREEKRLPSEELLHAKLPFFILEEESCICGLLCYLHRDVKKFGGASAPPSTYLSTAMLCLSTAYLSKCGFVRFLMAFQAYYVLCAFC